MRFRRHKGVTIIEVLISLAIFSIIVIPISTMVLHSVRINKQSEEKQQSMTVVQNLIESIKSLPDKEILSASSLKISAEDTLKVDREVNSETFKISGSVKGYDMEGHIKPLNQYKFNTNNSDIRKDINIYINETPSVTVDIKDKDGSTIKTVYPSNKDLVFIKKDEKTVAVNGDQITASINVENIGIFFDKSCEGKYGLTIENSSNVESSVYIFKKESSNATYDIKNEGGIFNIYSNILIPDEEYSNNNRVYEIYIKAKKGKDAFEAYSYRNIK